MRKIVAMQQNGEVVVRSVGADISLEELMANYHEMIGRDEQRYAFVNLMSQDPDSGNWHVEKYKHQIG